MGASVRPGLSVWLAPSHGHKVSGQQLVVHSRVPPCLKPLPNLLRSHVSGYRGAEEARPLHPQMEPDPGSHPPALLRVPQMPAGKSLKPP